MIPSNPPAAQSAATVTVDFHLVGAACDASSGLPGLPQDLR